MFFYKVIDNYYYYYIVWIMDFIIVGCGEVRICVILFLIRIVRVVVLEDLEN